MFGDSCCCADVVANLCCGDNVVVFVAVVPWVGVAVVVARAEGSDGVATICFPIDSIECDVDGDSEDVRARVIVVCMLFPSHVVCDMDAGDGRFGGALCSTRLAVRIGMKNGLCG